MIDHEEYAHVFHIHRMATRRIISKLDGIVLNTHLLWEKKTFAAFHNV